MMHPFFHFHLSSVLCEESVLSVLCEESVLIRNGNLKSDGGSEEFIFVIQESLFVQTDFG